MKDLFTAENIRATYRGAIESLPEGRTANLRISKGALYIRGWVRHDKKGGFDGDICLIDGDVIKHTAMVRGKSKSVFLDCIESAYALMEGFIRG